MHVLCTVAPVIWLGMQITGREGEPERIGIGLGGPRRLDARILHYFDILVSQI